MAGHPHPSGCLLTPASCFFLYAAPLPCIHYGWIIRTYRKRQVNAMSYISPALREQWENVPVYIKNRILEANVSIETAEDLRTCVALVEKQEQCCGDL